MYLKKLLRLFGRAHRPKSTVDEQSIASYFKQLEEGNNIESIDDNVWTDEQHHRVYQTIQETVYRKQHKIVGKQKWFQVAAVAATVLLGMFIGREAYNRRNLQTVRREFVAGAGEIKNITLTDGTRIWLNNTSKLTYMENKEERKIQLAGEAYFEVAGNAHKPFRIQSGDMLVDVLGTSFNVRAHRDEPIMQVSVQSGSIAVSSQQSANKRDEAIHLHANEQLSYHINERKFDAVKHLAVFCLGDWRSGRLQYQAVPLRLIIGDLERRFGVHISANESVLNCLITATFDHDALTKILTILASTIEGDVIYETGIYKLTGKRCS